MSTSKTTTTSSSSSSTLSSSTTTATVRVPVTFEDFVQQLHQAYGDTIAKAIIFQIESWYLSTFESKDQDVAIKPTTVIERNAYEVGLPLYRLCRQTIDAEVKEQLNKISSDSSLIETVVSGPIRRSGFANLIKKEAYMEHAVNTLFKYADSNNVWPPSIPIDLDIRKRAFEKWQNSFDQRIHLPQSICESVFLHVTDKSHLYINEMNQRGTSDQRRTCPSKIDLTKNIIQREALLCARLLHFTLSKTKNTKHQLYPSKQSAVKRQKIDA